MFDDRRDLCIVCMFTVDERLMCVNGKRSQARFRYLDCCRCSVVADCFITCYTERVLQFGVSFSLSRDCRRLVYLQGRDTCSSVMLLQLIIVTRPDCTVNVLMQQDVMQSTHRFDAFVCPSTREIAPMTPCVPKDNRKTHLQSCAAYTALSSNESIFLIHLLTIN